MSSLWHKIKGLGKKAVKTVTKTFTDPGSAIKELGGSSILAGFGIPSVSGVGSSLVDMAKDVDWKRELYRGLEGYIPGTDINPIDRYLGKDIARENLKYQEDAYNYQKWLNDQQMLREDTAYQRKLNDITGAGFNPILATGGSGLSSSPLRAGSAPQMADTSGALREGIGQVLGIMTGFAGLKKTKAETALLNSQKENQDIINKYEDEALKLKNQGQALFNLSTTLDNQLKSGTMASKIEKSLYEASNEQKRGLLYDSELVLNKLHITTEELDQAYTKVKIALGGKELDLMDKKILTESIAILQKWAEYKNYKWDTDWFHNMNLPSNFNTSGWSGLALLLGGTGGQVFANLVDFYRSISTSGNGYKNYSEGFLFPWKVKKGPFDKSYSHNWITERWENYSNNDYGVRRNY